MYLFGFICLQDTMLYAICQLLLSSVYGAMAVVAILLFVTFLCVAGAGALWLTVLHHCEVAKSGISC